MKFSIFAKLLAIFLIVSTVPLVISNFLIISTYEGTINKYFPEKQGPPGEELLLTHRNIKVQAVLIALLVIVLIVFISIIINRNLVYPLRRLVKGTREVSKGNLDVKVIVRTRDEIEELADSFNQMIKDLKESRSSLEESKNILEVKVIARTKALEEERASLEEKVEQRTKELQERIDELEKFHKLTVGRELKMVELKTEMERLKMKLKNK